LTLAEDRSQALLVDLGVHHGVFALEGVASTGEDQPLFALVEFELARAAHHEKAEGVEGFVLFALGRNGGRVGALLGRAAGEGQEHEARGSDRKTKGPRGRTIGLHDVPSLASGAWPRAELPG